MTNNIYEVNSDLTNTPTAPEPRFTAPGDLYAALKNQYLGPTQVLGKGPKNSVRTQVFELQRYMRAKCSYIYRKNQPILAIFVTTDSVRDLLSDNYDIRTIFQLWIDYHAKKWKFVFQRNPIPILIKQVTSNISLFQQEMMFAHDCWSTGNQIQCKQLLDKAKISAEMSLKQCWLLACHSLNELLHKITIIHNY